MKTHTWAGLVVGLLALGSRGAADAKEPGQGGVGVLPMAEPTPEQMERPSTAAVAVLRHLEQARAALIIGDGHAALNELQRADALLSFLQNRARSTTKSVTDRLLPSQMGDSLERDGRDYSPMFAVLNEGAVAPGPGSRAVVSYVEADLPLWPTHALVRKAEAEVKDGNFAAAEKTARVAQAGQVYLSMATTEPVGKAEIALWGAARSVASGAGDQAKGDLEVAARELEIAASEVNHRAVEETERLRGDVSGAIATLGRDASTSFERLDDLWERGRRLGRESEERVTSTWFQLLGEDARANLLEARLYVDSAANDALRGRNPWAAKNDLRLAEIFVDEARAEASTVDKPRVTLVRDEVDTLLARVDPRRFRDAAPARGDFQRVVNDLQELTNRL